MVELNPNRIKKILIGGAAVTALIALSGCHYYGGHHGGHGGGYKGGHYRGNHGGHDKHFKYRGRPRYHGRFGRRY